MTYRLKSAIYQGQQLALIDRHIPWPCIGYNFTYDMYTILLSEQVLVGNGITCYSNGITRLTIFWIKHKIIIATIFFFSSILQNTITSCSTKKQLYRPIIVHTVQRSISHLFQDQSKAVIELLSTYGSGSMLMSQFLSVEAVNIPSTSGHTNLQTSTHIK